MTLYRMIGLSACLLVFTCFMNGGGMSKSGWIRKLLFASTNERAQNSAAPNVPVPFGYKCAWIIVKSDDPRAVAEQTGLPSLHEIGWSAGIDAGYDLGTFVTPSVEGWVFIVSQSFADDPSTWKPLMEKLSTRFGESYYFATHRIVELQSWAVYRAGTLVRWYEYVGESGEINHNEGERLPAEIALGTGWDVEPYPNEETVMKLAAVLSLSPTSLDETLSTRGAGILLNRPVKREEPTQIRVLEIWE